MRSRRKFLGEGMALAGAAGLAAWLPVAARAATSLTRVPLADRLWLVRGTAANVVVAAADDGLLLVDGGAAADAEALKAFLAAEFPGLPLRFVINTHWHPEHSGFNSTARAQGADVVAHENTRLWLSTTVNARWQGKVYRPQPAAALPNRTFFYGPQKLEFGGRSIEYVHLGQAHTDGDILVRFTEENLIVAGDAAAPGRYPIVDPASNGWLGGLHSATKALIARSDEATRIIPGQGEPCGLAALKAQEELCFTVIQRIGESYYKGETWEELLARAPTREFDAQYGDPSQFLKLAYDTAWYHVNEIRRVAR
jgi:cyclase